MKKYLNIKILFLIISILIIIAGITTLFIKGFEKSIELKKGTRIEIYIPNGYEKQDIIRIAKESFDTDEILFLEIEKLNQVAGIKVINYTEEQLENYINKISEKYEMDKEEIEYYEILVPEVQINTIIKPYILPLILTTILSLTYLAIKNIRTNKVLRILLKVLEILVITLGIYFSLILLCRLQFSMYTMPLALTIYVITLLIATNKKCE